MVTSASPPRLLLNEHCQVCEFRQRCLAEATAKDDLSLLRGMGEKEIVKYGRRGIFTVMQLSCTFRPPRKMKRREERRLGHSHALQALAIREKKVHVLGSPQLPDAQTRVYLDIEGDLERRFCYLFGVVVRVAEVEERHSFWADSPTGELKLLEQFLDLMSRHPGAWVYTYGSYEALCLRRMGKDAGREEEVGRILARTFNLLSIIYLHVYFPTRLNGLKDIGEYLAFHWTEPNASGIQSVVWRWKWERTGDGDFKGRLTTYNMEDCDALRRVTGSLYAICNNEPPTGGAARTNQAVYPVARIDEMALQSSRRDWCRPEFAVADFGFINERAQFDYQRDRIYVRTSKVIRKSRRRNRGCKGKKNLRFSRRIELSTEECPFCGSVNLTRTPNRTLTRFAFDLRITPGSVRRWVTRYTTSYHCCGACERKFLPWEYLRLDPHGHALKSWAMNQHVVHRTTLAHVAEMIKENFGLSVFHPDVCTFKMLVAHYYERAYQRLLEKLLSGSLIHADETEIHLKDGSKGYVWVFTSLEEAYLLYRPSREGGFLRDLLKGFRGVLVSDFYAPYDSLDCPQQKCLIHLIRDFNEDIRGNPWDEELKSLASDFGRVLRSVITSVDQHGLRARCLEKHKVEVGRFFDSLAGKVLRSDVAHGYHKRLLKYRDKLFAFLDHDGVPWNNNNAEHAVKQFADYRESADGLLTEAGLKQYLVLLSLRMTCTYKGVSFECH
jgi:hypothetical protein